MHIERLQNKINRRLFPRFISIRSVHISTSFFTYIFFSFRSFIILLITRLFTHFYSTPAQLRFIGLGRLALSRGKKGFSCRSIVVCFGHLVFGCYSDKRAPPNERKKEKLLQLQGRLLLRWSCSSCVNREAKTLTSDICLHISRCLSVLACACEHRIIGLSIKSQEWYRILAQINIDP